MPLCSCPSAPLPSPPDARGSQHAAQSCRLDLPQVQLAGGGDRRHPVDDVVLRLLLQLVKRSHFYNQFSCIVNGCRYSVNGGGNAFDNAAFAASVLSLLALSMMLLAFLLLRHKVIAPAQTRRAKRYQPPRSPVTLPQEPALIRPYRIPLQSVSACFLFCAPTFAMTVFILSTAEPTQLYIVLGLLLGGLFIWSVLATY